MIRLTNYIMGVPVDAQSPLDEIALSTLKEVASQCVALPWMNSMTSWEGI